MMATVPVASGQREAFEGSLLDYLSLDAGGVTIGDAVFSDFRVLPRQEGASGFFSEFVGVTPLFDDPLAPGFRFDIMDSATAPDLFELRLSFRVSGVLVDRAWLSLTPQLTFAYQNGGVDALADLTATGDPANALGSLVTFVTSETADRDASSAFFPFEDLTVEFDAVIDGGGVGRPGETTASLGSATLRFGLAPTTPAIRRAGLVDATTFFIEFVSAPVAPHVVTASSDLQDGFPVRVVLSGGDGTTDQGGRARVEFSVAELPRASFFRVERAI